MAKISVLGSGSWGLALALLLHNNGHEVLLWSARPEDARKLREKRENPDRLPGVQIPEDIEILIDLERAIKSADVTVLAVASPYIRSTAHKMAPFIRKGQKIVNVAKGIEEKTLKTLSDVIEEEIPEGDVAVRSKSCGRSWKRNSYDLRGQRTYKGDCRISSEYFYESCIPRVYNAGYSGSRTWGST